MFPHRRDRLRANSGATAKAEGRKILRSVGNYNEQGFASMDKSISIVLETFIRALKHKDLKIIYGRMR